MLTHVISAILGPLCQGLLQPAGWQPQLMQQEVSGVSMLGPVRRMPHDQLMHQDGPQPLPGWGGVVGQVQGHKYGPVGHLP